jgi:voltage-gated potassium channel
LKITSRIYEILEAAKTGDGISRAFDVFIVTLISLNVIAVILGTVEALSSQYGQIFRWFEVFSIVIFTIEYTMRLWVCVTNIKFRHPILGRIKFALTPFAAIDLLAILPFYLPMIMPFDLRFIRAIRLLRLFRMLKIGRYSKSVQLLGSVLKNKKEELAITIFAVLVLLICASSLMYYVENSAQPEHFSNIPSAMWWGVSTLTTVGYGDVYPITTMGKILGAIISLLGVGIFALPTGILASGLVEAMQKKQSRRSKCPHCGKEFDKE